MLYLLDADTLITGERDHYPIEQFFRFWSWLQYQGEIGAVKVPQAMYSEVTNGNGPLVEWLTERYVREALLLDEQPEMSLVNQVISEGYAPDLTVSEMNTIGRDPFMVAHAMVDTERRRVVTFEVSKPSKQRQNRKLPDVCKQFSVQSTNLYRLIRRLEYSDDWVLPLVI